MRRLFIHGSNGGVDLAAEDYLVVVMVQRIRWDNLRLLSIYSAARFLSCGGIFKRGGGRIQHTSYRPQLRE